MDDMKSAGCEMRGETIRTGSAKVVFQCLEENLKDEKFGRAEAVTIQYSYPMKILVPEHAGNQICRWVFPITFGGGLVGGDKLDMEIDIQDNSCILLTSQESTKIYHCQGQKESSQDFVYRVGEEALLCVLPDYLVCYKDAYYTQNQVIRMHHTGNLVYLDWLTAGRIARKEEWQFQKYTSRTEVYVDGERIFKDNVELQNLPCMTIKQSMKKYKVTGTCIILGNKLEGICAGLSEKLGRTKKYGEKYETDLVCSVSKIQTKSVNGLYVRFLSRTTVQAFTVIQDIVKPLLPFIGADPFQNKYH